MSIMSDEIKLSEVRVLDFLNSNSKSARFFLDWKTDCVGCGFARFCTLEDVINTYHLDAEKFTKEVLKLIIQPNQRSIE